jgi:hypothetical protein
MLEAILNSLHNWFIIPGAARCGTFEVASGTLDVDFLQSDQYYRIEGSVFNDGLHQHPDAGMQDEVFTGTIYPMAVPRAVIELSMKIEKWCENNPESDKVSESFDGYSYTRSSGADGSAAGGWQTAFRTQLMPWKKVGGI